MADVIDTSVAERPDAAAATQTSPCSAADQAALVELLFFAYRDFVSEADGLLERFGFGRAHHRVLHFVNRNPGLKVADLLGILKITKQSLGRVLRDLVDQGFIEAREGRLDRRQRLLHTTDKGAALAQDLLALQCARVGRALAGLPDSETAQAAASFLFAMVDPDGRNLVKNLVLERSGDDRTKG